MFALLVGVAFLLLQCMQAVRCFILLSSPLPANGVYYCSSQTALVAAFSVKQLDLCRSSIPNPVWLLLCCLSLAIQAHRLCELLLRSLATTEHLMSPLQSLVHNQSDCNA